MTLSENVQVCVRCRPLIEIEKKNTCSVIVEVDEISATVNIKQSNAGNDVPLKSFVFDFAFGSESKQSDIYDRTARPVVNRIFEGYNATIFAYGQTGTGKTFNMDGDRSVPDLRGVIPNSFAHIFGNIAKADWKSAFLVRVSYLEVYDEEIRDLLAKDKKSKLEFRERPDRGVYVDDLTIVMVQSPEEMEEILDLGSRNRKGSKEDMDDYINKICLN
ncbi:hypothetical protein ACTXT7_000704 [Hymenolepis weldensis]